MRYVGGSWTPSPPSSSHCWRAAAFLRLTSPMAVSMSVGRTGSLLQRRRPAGGGRRTHDGGNEGSGADQRWRGLRRGPRQYGGDEPLPLVVGSVGVEELQGLPQVA